MRSSVPSPSHGLPATSRGWAARVGALVNLAGIVIAALWFAALLLAHLKIVTQPGPQEYNEPAIWHATWLLDHGRNPYTAAELPGALLCFGPLYNYVVLAFKPLFGIDYTAHRMVNLIFQAASLWVVGRLMWRTGAGLGITLLSAVFFYWMCLANIMVTARPDFLGHWLFLLGVFVPWERNYTRGATLFGLGCALLAFHCKAYFAVAAAATLLGHFAMRSRREACLFGVGFGALLGLSLVVCGIYFPYHYLLTVQIQQSGAAMNSNDTISLMHTAMLFERGWPFALPLGVGLASWLGRRRGVPAGAGAQFRPAEHRFAVLGAVFVSLLALVYFWMGRNGGALFTYHLHLLFPLMFVLGAHALDRPWLRTGFGVLLAGFVMASLDIPPVSDSSAPYRRMERLVYETRGRSWASRA